MTPKKETTLEPLGKPYSLNPKPDAPKPAPHLDHPGRPLVIIVPVLF